MNLPIFRTAQIGKDYRDGIVQAHFDVRLGVAFRARIVEEDLSSSVSTGLRSSSSVMTPFEYSQRFANFISRFMNESFGSTFN